MSLVEGPLPAPPTLDSTRLLSGQCLMESLVATQTPAMSGEHHPQHGGALPGTPGRACLPASSL